MAYQVVWSPKAIEDVEALASYIANDSAAYSAAVVRKILDITSKLNSFPLSGRIVPELGDPTLREKLAYSYRIIYKVEDETITIAAVIHGKRLLESDKINES
ncbi:MAG: type II toxin-antitoxin system RelE/ParE family toxin [Coleofasciculus sp. A1-SPW-01]|jgi:toxin ParE1/3/4|uniref:type II toxin-antitoxin system RelE/ParE family toxin n=1 Tax=Coleofasciculus TaxID=669368 RepID=UPI0032FF9A45